MQMATRRTVARLSIAVALLMATAGLAGAAPATRPFAQPGELSCTLTLVLPKGPITAGEPIAARYELRNESARLVEVLGGDEHTQLELFDAEGRRVAASPPFPRNIADRLFWTEKLAPAKSHAKYIIVSALYSFTRPGMYRLRARQLGDLPDLPVLCETTLRLDVQPRNPAQLKAAVATLFEPMRNFRVRPTYPSPIATKALYSVRDDAVIPALTWMAREWGDGYAARALRRLGTPAAKQAIAALAAGHGEARQAAQHGRRMDLKTTEWDLFAEATEEKS